MVRYWYDPFLFNKVTLTTGVLSVTPIPSKNGLLFFDVVGDTTLFKADVEIENDAGALEYYTLYSDTGVNGARRFYYPIMHRLFRNGIRLYFEGTNCDVYIYFAECTDKEYSYHKEYYFSELGVNGESVNVFNVTLPSSKYPYADMNFIGYYIWLVAKGTNPLTANYQNENTGSYYSRLTNYNLNNIINTYLRFKGEDNTNMNSYVHDCICVDHNTVLKLTNHADTSTDFEVFMYFMPTPFLHALSDINNSYYFNKTKFYSPYKYELVKIPFDKLTVTFDDKAYCDSIARSGYGEGSTNLTQIENINDLTKVDYTKMGKFIEVSYTKFLQYLEGVVE